MAYTVTSTADDGSAGTLRAAIFYANDHPGTTIDFAVDKVKLAKSLPMIMADTTIDGGGVTIDANNAGRVFFVAAGNVAISNLSVEDALARGGNGGNVTGNASGGGGGGGLGAGAAVFVNNGATATLTRVEIADAVAIGGKGGTGSISGRNDSGGGGGGLGGDGGDSNSGASGGGGGYEGRGGNGRSDSDYGGGGGGGGLFGAGGNGSPGFENGAGGGGGKLADGGDGGVKTRGAGGGAEGGIGGLWPYWDPEAGKTFGGGGGGVWTEGGNGGYGGGGGGGAARSGGSSPGGGAGGEFGGGGASFTSGGAGGFGGGGGGTGAYFFGRAGGNGGFGGGGGGGALGGGGGVFGGKGGTGNTVNPKTKAAPDGGGGAALGGAVFVRDGGTLILNDSTFTGFYDVTGGTTGGRGGATAGEARGQVMFLHGKAKTELNVTAGKTLKIGGKDAIAGDGALTKGGAGTLTLSSANSYSGGTFLDDGTLNLRLAANAAGSGPITFGEGSQTLKLPNTAMVDGKFENTIVSFGANDEIDLADLSFLAGTTATYDIASQTLSVVRQGAVYKFTLTKPAQTEFVARSDSDGSTKIILEPNGVLRGTHQDDRLLGHGRHDRLLGRKGDDDLLGGQGDDDIKGGRGEDWLSGGAGRNRLTGGEGDDVFAFGPGLFKGKGSEADNISKIADFEIGQDRIELDSGVFTVLAAGPLAEAAFHQGTTASDADDRILHNPSSGALRYDPDGIGGEKAILFARVQKDLDLSAADFIVV